MSAYQIFSVLQADPSLDETAARAGFFQWVLELPDETSHREAARQALAELPTEGLNRSAEAFRQQLQECLLEYVPARSRRNRRMH